MSDRTAPLHPLALVCDEEATGARAAELWTGCNFGCLYCLPVGRRWAHRCGPLPDGEGLCERRIRPRTCDPLDLAGLEAVGDGPVAPAFLSLMSDPYPPQEVKAAVTREAVATLHDYDVGVRILTKSGTRAVRDFDLLGIHPDDAFGATMTFVDEAQSREWEPRAASPAERLAGLAEAHGRGIPTWMSLTPVVDPVQALEVIRRAHDHVDLFSVGSLSEFEGGEPFDWPSFRREAIALCRRYGVPCHVRPDTRNAAAMLEHPAIAAVDRMMIPELWLEACRGRRPSWGLTA